MRERAGGGVGVGDIVRLDGGRAGCRHPPMPAPSGGWQHAAPEVATVESRLRFGVRVCPVSSAMPMAPIAPRSFATDQCTPKVAAMDTPTTVAAAPGSRHVLITGAGRGIGAATALAAAQRGWAVSVNYVANESA